MQPALEFRYALLSAPNLSVPFTFPRSKPLGTANPNDPSTQLTLLGHDLRAAVSDVIGGLRLVSHDALSPDARLQLERVRASSELLARLMDEGLAQILGDADCAATSPRHVLLSKLVYDLDVRWRGRAQEKGLTFITSVAENLPQSLALDRTALDRILSNILSNAIKYAVTGVIELRVELSPSGALRMAVTDQGPGFCADAMARLFDLGCRPRESTETGQGLGLHITRDLAGRLGGGVTVENRPCGGARVTVELPASSWTIRASLPKPHELPDLRGLKVLVAEDSATNQLVVGQMLRRMGAEYVIAADGVEALNCLKAESFDLALIDIEMPRLSGLDVIRHLRAKSSRHRSMPVLAISAYVLISNREAIYAAGADAILTKPLAGIDALGAAIGKLVNREKTSPEETIIVSLQPEFSLQPEYSPLAPALERLAQLAGQDSCGELVGCLCADLQGVKHDLLRGHADGNLEMVRGATHKLIALAGTMGANELHALGRAINAAAEAGDVADQGVAVDQAIALIGQLVSQVEALHADQGKV